MAYTPDVNDLMAKYGINTDGGTFHYNPNTAFENQPAPKNSNPYSVGSVLGTVGHLAADAGKFVYHQVADPIAGVGKAVAQYAPVVGGVAQHNASDAAARKNLEAQLKDASNRYRSTDPKFKIGKDEYQKRIKTVSDSLAKLSKDSSDYTKTLESAGDVTKNVAESALMLSPFAELTALKSGGAALKGAMSAANGVTDAARAAKIAAGVDIGKVTAAPLQGGAKAIAGNALKNTAKFALATKPAADAAIETPGDIQRKDWSKVGMNAAAFVGAPVAFKAAEKVLPLAGKIASDAFFTKSGSEINKLKFSDGNVNKFLNDLQAKAAAGDKVAAGQFKKYNDIAKVAEDHYQAEGTKAYSLAAYHAGQGMPTEGMSAKGFLDMQHTLAKSHNWVNDNLHRVGFDGQGRPLPTTAPKSPITGEPLATAAPVATKDGAAAFDAAVGSKGMPTPGPKISSARQAKIDAANAESEAAYKAAFKTPEQEAQQGVNGAAKGNFTVGRFDQGQAAELSRAFAGAKSSAEAHAILDAAAAAGKDFTKNPLIMSSLRKAAGLEDAAARKAALSPSAINRTVKLSVKGSGRTGMGNGYFPIYTEKPVAGFRSAAEVADLNVPNKAPFAFVGDTMRRMGISPEGSDPKEFGSQMATNFSNNLEGTQFAGKGGDILKDMFSHMDTTLGIFDPRMIKISNMQKFLGVSAGDAKLIRSALDRAYTNVPLGARALGEKLTDTLIQRLPGMREYLKAQSYGRFAANPIFWAKRDIKTDLVAGAEVGGKMPNIGIPGTSINFNKILGLAPSEDTLKALTARGYFSKGMSQVGDANDYMGDFRSMVAGQGSVADKMAMQAVSRYQMQSLGQMAEKFAAIHGTTIDKLMADNGQLGQEFDHLMRLTVGYGQKGGEAGGYLTSNFAKTLNVLVFPSRFDTKVGMAFAKYYGQQPPIVQGAIANGLLQTRQYLGTPDGKQWLQDNADAIATLKYFTPVETFANLMDSLIVPGQKKLPDFGAIGGLPVGVLSTILQHQGVAPDWLKQSPGVNPKTGELYAENLPVTDKARIQSALTDLVGSMYSWPGQTLGLTSKTKVTQMIPGLKPDTGSTTTVGNSLRKGAGSSMDMATPANIANFNSPITGPSNLVIDHSKYSKPKVAKAKKAPAYLNGFKTTTAHQMPKQP